MNLPDGLAELREDLPILVELVARTARWVHPEIFRKLPVWYPETARRQPLYAADFSRPLQNKKGEVRRETNVRAQKALFDALGSRRAPNWTVCHIWGFDDPKFAARSVVVQSHIFYSCIGNMVLLPTPLKACTDGVPAIKRMLRICAMRLYGFVCEYEGHDDHSRHEAEKIRVEAAAVRRGELIGDCAWPASWPTCSPAEKFPPGLRAASDRARHALTMRRAWLDEMVNKRQSAGYFPRDEVCRAFAYWERTLSRGS